MSLREIKKLAKLGESDTLEFKSSTAQIRKACETLCGFLNHQGGIVLIGVNDQGELIGQMVSDDTRQTIAHELSKFEPSFRPSVTYVPFKDNKSIIIFKVNLGEHGPYAYDGRAYDRVESTTVRMPQPRYDQLVAKRAQLNYSWESFEASKYSVEDLDQDLILGIVRKAVETKRLPEIALRQEVPTILERLKLLENGHLNNGAIVLFAKELFPRYPQCQLKMARFKGLDRTEFLDSHIVYGNFFVLFEEAMQFFRRHLPVAAKIIEGKAERVETPLIPFKAIREAMINSLCHKDYTQHGGSIGLAIYDDRMELFNDGGLLQGVTVERIKSGFSKLRNPIIADVLFKGDLIEKWGRGIQEIIKKCMDAGDPDPEFIADEYTFKVIFRFPSSLKPMVLHLESYAPSIDIAMLSQRQKQIIKILEESDKLKASEIMNELKEKTTDRTLRKDLTVLKKHGMISYEGHSKTAVWFFIQK